jgi:hypothetical protein
MPFARFVLLILVIWQWVRATRDVRLDQQFALWLVRASEEKDAKKYVKEGVTAEQKTVEEDTMAAAGTPTLVPPVAAVLTDKGTPSSALPSSRPPSTPLASPPPAASKRRYLVKKARSPSLAPAAAATTKAKTNANEPAIDYTE